MNDPFGDKRSVFSWGEMAVSLRRLHASLTSQGGDTGDAGGGGVGGGGGGGAAERPLQELEGGEGGGGEEHAGVATREGGGVVGVGGVGLGEGAKTASGVG